MQKLRLFFPLIVSRQLVAGVNTAYSQEIKKLRRFGINNISPYLPKINLRKYPYKLTFIYYTSSYIDMISLLTLSTYIIHLFESSASIQSSDYRVVPKIEIYCKKVHGINNEGCEISFEKYIKD